MTYVVGIEVDCNTEVEIDSTLDQFEGLGCQENSIIFLITEAVLK